MSEAPQDPARRDPAKPRFMAIQAMRWAGLALVVIGLLAIAGRISLPDPVGPVLVVVGVIEALIVPVVLARRWKSPAP